MTLRVLVVDESPHVGDVLVSALEREGCRATIARDPTEALRLSHTLHPNLIAIEMGARVDHGFVTELVKDVQLQETAFIIIVPSRRGVPQAITARALRVFEKPFYPAEVVATAVEALNPTPTRAQQAS